MQRYVPGTQRYLNAWSREDAEDDKCTSETLSRNPCLRNVPHYPFHAGCLTNFPRKAFIPGSLVHICDPETLGKKITLYFFSWIFEVQISEKQYRTNCLMKILTVGIPITRMK